MSTLEVSVLRGAPTGAAGAGAPRRGNASGPRQTQWSCIAMCTDTDPWRPSRSHGCSQRGQPDIASAEILSLPGKRRGQTAGPADEIWSRRHREPRGAQHRPSVGHPTRAVHAQTSWRCPCGKGAPRVVGGLKSRRRSLSIQLDSHPKNSICWIPRMGLRFPMVQGS